VCFTFKTLPKVILILIPLDLNIKIYIVAIGVNDYFAGSFSFSKLLACHLRLDAVLRRTFRADADAVSAGYLSFLFQDQVSSPTADQTRK